jgi:hypothetical protein
MNPIALVHPTNTISPLEILEHLDPLFGGGDLASSRVCSTFELHDALLLLFLGHRCGS